jgi:DNA-binding SARP family transcriptional activator
MLTLRTLGSLSLTGEDGEELTAILSQPKRCALLIYLTVAHPEDFVRRDTLLALFWPEQGEARARNALSQSLHFLRQHLPEGAIVSRGRDEVRIGPGTVRADAGAFESAVASGYWREALDHYTGSFLEGFHVGEAPGFEDWVFGERERLREAAAGAAWSLAREHTSRPSPAPVTAPRR